MTIYCGIDPGKNGGIAVIQDQLIFTYATPTLKVKNKQQYDIDGMKQLLSDVDFITIEKQQAMPGQGVTSMFSIGYGYGLWLGLAKSLDVPILEVRPQQWKKKYSLDKDKNACILKAKMLYPEVNLKRSERCKKDHDGIAEALLLADYGKKWDLNS